MRHTIGIAMGMAAAAMMWGGSASAQGLEFLHSQRVEGGRVCFTDHFHSGSSSGQATRMAAERAAIAGWSSFTAWEYGGHWASWQIAASRGVNCSQSSGWSCQIEARPCRPQAGGGARAPRRAAKKAN